MAGLELQSSIPDHFTQLYTKHSSQHGFDLEHEKKDHLLQYMDAVVLSGDHVDPFFMKKISRAWNAKRRNALRGCSAVEPIYIYMHPQIMKKEEFSQVCENLNMLRCCGLDLMTAITL